MTSKRRENINLVSFIFFSFLVISFSKQLHIVKCWFLRKGEMKCFLGAQTRKQCF